MDKSFATFGPHFYTFTQFFNDRTFAQTGRQDDSPRNCHLTFLSLTGDQSEYCPAAQNKEKNRIGEHFEATSEMFRNVISIVGYVTSRLLQQGAFITV